MDNGRRNPGPHRLHQVMARNVPLAGSFNLPRLHRIACNAAESDMVHAGVDHLRLPRCWAITQAVVGRAEVGAAFDHLAGNPDLRVRAVVTLVWRGNARSDWRAAAGLYYFVGGPLDKPVTSPFPYIPCHIV